MLLSSSVRQPIRRAGPEGNHSNDRVNAGDRQYCYDVLMHGAYKYVNARLATVSRLISMTPELTLPPFGRRCLSPLTPAIRVSVS
jgi:hypothetical protein